MSALEKREQGMTGWRMRGELMVVAILNQVTGGGLTDGGQLSRTEGGEGPAD